jgi:cell division protein FtsN
MWFAVGFIAGAFSVGLAWLKYGPEELRSLTAGLQGTPAAEEGKAKGEEDEHNAAPRPQFQFYSLLPDMEVVVSDDEVDRRARAAQPAPPPPPAAAPGVPVAAATPAPSATPAPAHVSAPPVPAPPPAAGGEEVLMLQVGAFRSAADAEGLKAQLALKGLQAAVQSATINRDTIYRVRLGPFRGIDQLKGARDRLKSSGYESVVVRLK